MNKSDVPITHLKSNIQQEPRLGGSEKPLHGRIAFQASPAIITSLDGTEISVTF